jgi:hypothetical protein
MLMILWPDSVRMGQTIHRVAVQREQGPAVWAGPRE